MKMNIASKNKKLSVKQLYGLLEQEIENAKANKTFKYEVPIEGKQGGVVQVANKPHVMLASNNYLGLANHPRIVQAAKDGLEKYGFGMASVRFLCGTQNIHLALERKIAEFLGVEDAILHSSCFAANDAFFTAIFSSDLGVKEYRDVIYSDQLNHASIIDGIRLARIANKTTDFHAYKHSDLADLERLLQANQQADYRTSVIVTDGVFSMEGEYATIDKFVALAKKYDALLVVDDSHATGVLGKTGRGTPEHCGVHGQVDVITGTLGKALGGAAGGFIAGKKPLIDFMRQKSRPYTFSNTLPPPIAAAALEAICILEEDPSLVEKLHSNTSYFRQAALDIGFKILDGIHPIVPVMLGEASTAQDMSQQLLDEDVYVRGLWYPVVPKGEARLRVQISAGHEKKDLDKALQSFEKVGKKLGVLA